MSAGPGSTIVFPPPLDLLEPFLRAGSRASNGPTADAQAARA